MFAAPTAATAPPPPVEITPIVPMGDFWLKRDDLFDCGGARGGKARALLAMLRAKGVKGVTCAGNRHSPMVSRVARVAKVAGVPARCHIAQANTRLPQEVDALAHGATLVPHKIGFLSNLVAKARADAAARGWVFVPLGVEGPEYYGETKAQVRDLPAGVQRIVVTVGSGMTAAAILAGLDAVGRADIPVLGVRVGMDPAALLDRWAPKDWRRRLEILPVPDGESFEHAAAQTQRWGIDLDPHYEAKAAAHVRTGDLFWLTAIRSVMTTPCTDTDTRTADAPATVPAAPAWARGFAIDELKAVAALFHRHDAGFVQGAFVGVKETQVAEWRAAGALRQAPGCAAVVQQAASKQAVRDFAGRVLARIAPGDLVIKRIAGDPEPLRALLAGLLPNDGRAWLEIWQEREADRLLADSLGFRWVGSKIRASSEIVGVWARGVLGVAATPPIEQAALVRLRLPPLDVAPLAAQIAAVPWADHYSGYNKRHSWTACALRGYGGRTEFIIKPAEMSKKWKAEHAEEMWWTLDDTPLRAALPAAEPLIAAVPGRKHRIRLMRLRARDGELTRHADITDPDAGTAPGRLLRIHVPIVTNAEVWFQQWLLDGGRRRACMSAGEAWYLDTRKPHTANNDGDCDRIHLVMDVESCPELLALVPVGEAWQ